MSIIDNEKIRNRIKEAFPQSFINMQLELIIHPGQNSYFLLKDVGDELTLNCKILEWLSKDACKASTPKTQKYHLDGINTFLGTSFSKEDMTKIYTYLGNAVNRARSIKFIESGYDFSVLSEVAQ